MHAVQAEYWNQIRSGILPEGSPVASWLLASCGLALDNSAAPLHSFEFLVDKCHAEHSPRKKSGFRSWLWKHAPDAVAALVRLVGAHGGEHGGVEHWVDGDHTLPSQAVHQSNCRHC